MVLAAPELTMRTESRLMTVVDWMALAIFAAVLLLSARALAADGGTDAPRAPGVVRHGEAVRESRIAYVHLLSLLMGAPGPHFITITVEPEPDVHP